MYNSPEVPPSRASVASFFDRASTTRDRLFQDQPVLGFEQEMRQLVLVELLDPRPQDHVLDLGCGNARDGRVLAAQVAQWVGVDLSLEMLLEGKRVMQRLRLPCAVTLADAARLPFEDESFDKVACSEVIEHIPEWRAILPEVLRVLKPDGGLVITTPNRRSLYRPLRVLMDGVRRARGRQRVHPYDEWKTLPELAIALTGAGFSLGAARGACFVPGQWTYLLPRAIQRLVVGATRLIERTLQRRLPGFGYLVAIAARKPGATAIPPIPRGTRLGEPPQVEHQSQPR